MVAVWDVKVDTLLLLGIIGRKRVSLMVPTTRFSRLVAIHTPFLTVTITLTELASTSRVPRFKTLLIAHPSVSMAETGPNPRTMPLVFTLLALTQLKS